MTLSAQTRAEKSAAAMWARDRASPWLGVSQVSVAPGEAVFEMTVADHHLNGHNICHGGFIFTLADTAFAFACNSFNQATVAQTNQISFLKPGQLGDVLTARCAQVTTAGRSGIYDVEVTNQAGDVIAVMRGNARTVKGQVFDETT